jgi:peptidoglycan/xylan/chitin deacetylase (PgdA/CDA1 family)
MFKRLAAGRALRGAIAFTIDDGYYDHAEIAEPIFSEFDCPVTVFVVTGFLDGRLWLWWDQIEYVLRATARDSIRLSISGMEVEYGWSNELEQARVRDDIVRRCKTVSDEKKHATIAVLSRQAEVELPGRPPSEYAPMTWGQLRKCERGVMEFGPHTVSHPILSRASDVQSRFELCESWSRLTEVAEKPVAVFCYPNGRLEDFGVRELCTLAELRFLGAVIGEPGYVVGSSVVSGPDSRFMVRRFAWPEDLPHLAQIVTGIEKLKVDMRGEV